MFACVRCGTVYTCRCRPCPCGGSVLALTTDEYSRLTLSEAALEGRVIAKVRADRAAKQDDVPGAAPAMRVDNTLTGDALREHGKRHAGCCIAHGWDPYEYLRQVRMFVSRDSESGQLRGVVDESMAEFYKGFWSVMNRALGRN